MKSTKIRKTIEAAESDRAKATAAAEAAEQDRAAALDAGDIDAAEAAERARCRGLLVVEAADRRLAALRGDLAKAVAAERLEAGRRDLAVAKKIRKRIEDLERGCTERAAADAAAHLELATLDHALARLNAQIKATGVAGQVPMSGALYDQARPALRPTRSRAEWNSSADKIITKFGGDPAPISDDVADAVDARATA